MPRITIDQQKRNAAAAAIEFVENGMTVGLGTGSTAEYFIRMLGQRVKDGLKVVGVPSSIATARLAKRLKIPLVNDESGFKKIDFAIDGADEVDPQLNLIKGGGGALTREKIVASRSDRFVVIIDEKKLVDQLGKFKLPVEALPFGWQSTIAILRLLGARVSLRKKEGKKKRTDNGNYIVDCAFNRIDEPAALAQQIKQVTGVIEVGLFVGMTDLVLVGRRDGSVEERWAV